MEKQHSKNDREDTHTVQDFVDEYGFPLTFPETVLSNMRQSLELSQEDFQMLHDYFDAANNLYARIPLRKLYEICNSQNPPISEDDFLAVAGIISHERNNNYVIVSPSVFSDALPRAEGLEQELVAEHLYALDDEDYLAMAKAQVGKPWYVPEKSLFLKYADDRYTEETPQRLALTNFLRNTQKSLRCPPEEIAEELQDLMRLDLALQDILEDAQRLGISFENQRDLWLFIKRCLDLSYHSRQYIHCGHTAAELNLPQEDVNEAMASISYDADYRDPLEAFGQLMRELSAQQKTFIGKPSKNAPCPCGSGRKYKNCCGKAK